jgi:hypothetical protein
MSSELIPRAALLFSYLATNSPLLVNSSTVIGADMIESRFGRRGYPVSAFGSQLSLAASRVERIAIGPPNDLSFASVILIKGHVMPGGHRLGL